MSFEKEFDLSSGRKLNAKQGRRASNSLGSSDTAEELVNASGSISPLGTQPRVRKTGVWADEGSKSAKTRTSNILEQERFQNESQQASDDIPVIPDIDDLSDDPLNLFDVKVPNVAVKKSTYKELDKDNQLENLKIDEPNFGNIGDIDLSILSNRLHPEADVKHVDNVWTLESLAADLSQSFQTA